MPEIIPENDNIRSLEGLHLYHYAMSNCSQRVRMVLCEKDLDWHSHHVDLLQGEQLTAEYQSINPNGVVPTLVDQGRVIIDSSDIIQYIDEHYPQQGIRLMPTDAAGAAAMAFWIKAAAAVQVEVRTITFAWLFLNPEQRVPKGIDYYARHQQNAELVAFRRELATHGRVPDEKRSWAKASLQTYFDRLNVALEGTRWLAGAHYSLADIANCVNVHRARLCRLDFGRLESLDKWYAEIAERPAFQRAIIDYQPAPSERGADSVTGGH